MNATPTASVSVYHNAATEYAGQIRFAATPVGPAPTPCNAQGQCICVPKCLDRVCGPDRFVLRPPAVLVPILNGAMLMANVCANRSVGLDSVDQIRFVASHVEIAHLMDSATPVTVGACPRLLVALMTGV